MLSKFVLAAGLLAGVVAAQSNATNITIDPASVPDTQKGESFWSPYESPPYVRTNMLTRALASWCNGEENVCNTLCDSDPKENTCSIVCQSVGTFYVVANPADIRSRVT